MSLASDGSVSIHVYTIETDGGSFDPFRFRFIRSAITVHCGVPARVTLMTPFLSDLLGDIIIGRVWFVTVYNANC